jgi:hypothetical protein
MSCVSGARRAKKKKVKEHVAMDKRLRSSGSHFAERASHFAERAVSHQRNSLTDEVMSQISQIVATCAQGKNNLPCARVMCGQAKGHIVWLRVPLAKKDTAADESAVQPSVASAKNVPPSHEVAKWYELVPSSRQIQTHWIVKNCDAVCISSRACCPLSLCPHRHAHHSRHLGG